jgi:hypothetical protein
VRDALSVERRLNANRFGLSTDEFRRFVPKLKTNLAVFVFLREYPNAKPTEWPGQLNWLTPRTNFVDAAWNTAEQSTTLQYMPREEVQRDADIYRGLTALGKRLDAAETALNEARRFAIHDPDPSRLSAAQLDRQIDLTMEVLLQYALVGRTAKNIGSAYPDFTPSLTRDDVYGILNAETNADDQKAIDALVERGGRLERKLGVDAFDDGPERTTSDQATQ